MDGYDEDSTNQLVVRYAPESDGTGKLSVRAAAGGFAGEASAWFDTVKLMEFATSLATYPLPDIPTTAISGGFGSLDRSGVAEEHIGIVARPVEHRGQLGVRIHLSMPSWQDTRPESVNEVWLELLTTYERLRLFSDHMVRVLKGQLNEAQLGGEQLG
jgi:hypothetical protein